ncbi:MAG: hypothetical protein FWC09_02460 [Lachnospiraceae bacterium]|nr:hypothetical protein [Lachnospiraceae bacterium]
MPWRTEYYTDTEGIEHQKYIFFNQAAADLNILRSKIQVTKSNLKTSYDSLDLSYNTGDCCDTYDINKTTLTTLIKSALGECNNDISTISLRITNAKSLADKYKNARNKMRDVWYDGPGGGFTYEH